MHTHQLRSQLRTPLSLREAFEFFTDPRQLARQFPESLLLQLREPADTPLRLGTELSYDLSWCHVPLRWRSVITAFEPPFHFVDELRGGPYRFWRHRHTFRPSVEGTIVEDCIDYALPGGPLGRAVHHLFLRQQLISVFRYREEAMAEIFAQEWPALTLR